MAYSSVDNLLIGKIPLPANVDPQQYVDNATDEVDSYIGFTYVTPIDVSDTSVVDRPVRLLLKRIANMIATGRLILAMSGGAEMQKVHAYGRSLIRDASEVLTQISEGKVVLTSVPTVAGGTETTGPQIFNLDSESNVEAFYNRVLGQPTPSYPFPYAGHQTW